MTTASVETPEVRELLARAMRLSPAQRESIAFELLDSLEPAQDSDEVKKAWRAELARRIRDIEEGKVDLLDAKESIARLRLHLREKFGR